MSTNRLSDSINTITPVLENIALELHANPELGFEEFKAVERQVDILKKWGFDVTVPFCGLNTAYKAVSGSGSPTFCFMAEYDALPEIGHACGHNLIAITALGAGKSLADTLKEQNILGTIIIMGTPGEESKGGKVKIIEQNGLAGIDAAIMAHP